MRAKIFYVHPTHSHFVMILEDHEASELSGVTAHQERATSQILTSEVLIGARGIVNGMECQSLAALPSRQPIAKDPNETAALCVHFSEITVGEIFYQFINRPKPESSNLG